MGLFGKQRIVVFCRISGMGGPEGDTDKTQDFQPEDDTAPRPSGPPEVDQTAMTAPSTAEPPTSGGEAGISEDQLLSWNRLCGRSGRGSSR